MTSVGILTLLGLGLVFGLKHATEVDHVVAVSTIVSEHRNILRSAIVGALWGLGHTASLVAVGLLVLVFRVAVKPSVASWLEFGVALMIIALGVLALVRVFRKRSDLHIHRHQHNGLSHVHVHFHEQEAVHLHSGESHSHEISRVGLKPVLVGAVHGLAGSAALTLLVLTEIRSVALGLFYLGVFGIGSTVGMLLMSGLIGVPFALSARRLSGINFGLQTAAGGLSIVFGLWYAFEAGKNLVV
jgi:ABC-type nickel/cobalt efflux system permease component RcnA